MCGGTAQPGMNVDLRMQSFWVVVGCAGTAGQVVAAEVARHLSIDLIVVYEEDAPNWVQTLICVCGVFGWW